MSDIQKRLDAMLAEPRDSVRHVWLGNVLRRNNTTVTIDHGYILTPQRCFLEAIEVDPTWSYAHYLLGTTLAPGESVILRGGIKTTNIDCFVKAIDLDSSQMGAYRKLGELLSEDDTVTFGNGKTLTGRDCYYLGSPPHYFYSDSKQTYA